MKPFEDLLIEIGTEELPPKALKKLSEAFGQSICQGITKANLSYAGYQNYATPRRLAILVKQLQSQQADNEIERKGPAVQAAFDEEGCPTPAALGFAKSCGVEVEQLTVLDSEKGSWLVHRLTQQGQATADLIHGIVQQALDQLPIPKRMRWASYTEQFIRPVHWAVILFGSQYIPGAILSVSTGNETRGHRFHHPQKMFIGEPEAYAPLLQSEGHVIADFNVRREAIRAQVLEVANRINGTAVIDDDLLDEVTAMVEWPVALLGSFEQRFLQVPTEALISAMKNHQKYFHVVDDQQQLMAHFITVANLESRDPSVVQAGNERVIRPRLADAEFFWLQDKKQTLEQRVGRLKSIVFQTQLGSLHDKVLRVSQLAGFIANALSTDEIAVQRAAYLCKSDLVTEMVGEFPELQGIMGQHYALHDGESEAVAKAIVDHYKPTYAGGPIPETRTGMCVALADKLDTLVGIFGIGQAPTGDKDPFALRRATLGVIRILIEGKLDLELNPLLMKSVEIYKAQHHTLDFRKKLSTIYAFILGRMEPYYTAQDFATDVIDAVICLQPNNIWDMDQRLRALSSFRSWPQAQSLSAANKRISNLLKKLKDPIPTKVDNTVFTEQAEKQLHKTLQQLESETQPLIAVKDYASVMMKWSELKEPVDRFFDEVMVMVDDPAVQNNRLALLQQLRNLFLRMADLSRLQ